MRGALTCRHVDKTFRYAVSQSLLQDTLLRRPHRATVRDVKVLSAASLEVRPGEWLGLYGANGSGKTTLMRIIAGLLPPDRGEVEVDGDLSLFLGLGTGFELELSADRNIYLHGLLHGLSRKEIRGMTDEVIDFAELGEHREMPLKYYSSGMLLRLGYAAVAHMRADAYLFDEVLAVGDAAFRTRCRAHMARLKAEGKGAILVSHSIHDLRKHCDRIVTIRDGGVVPYREEEDPQLQRIIAAGGGLA